jgi:DNA-binding transcriptional MerR regulator
MAETETWGIQEVARATGTTSRTLRHYQAMGLLHPTDVGPNGYRRYGSDALIRLQRILLLRDLGLGLRAIGRILDAEVDPATALRAHVAWLEQEKDRLTRQIASVTRTIEKISEGDDTMATDMFDGFDHARYKDEVEQRWGGAAYRSSDEWWRGMGEGERRAWRERSESLAADWTAAAVRGLDPSGPEAEQLALRHVAWLGGIPGTPGAGSDPVAEYVLGLADLYVADERFAATYGGPIGAAFVRDALRAHVAARL